MKIKDLDGRWQKVPLTNPEAVASVKRAGWRWDPRLRALVIRVGHPVRRCVAVSLEEAECTMFDLLDVVYCEAAGLPAPSRRVRR
jgi:hypothetical protein